jgi:tRNA1Val (adenine37-N6)-methyltransferase
VKPATGIVRPARRPPGWIAPGPRPQTPADRAELWPQAGEDLCYLAGDWRILQRTQGHRFSLDDLVTAHFASVNVTAPARLCDLGCGIGSVLLFLAWRFPAASLLGIEAQPMSAGLARRSIAWNGAEGRCEVRDGDFREVVVGETFDLVTGTPPYFPRGTGTESDADQRGPCRFEFRGGVEAYCARAAALLKPGAPFVGCAPTVQRERVLAAVKEAGLQLDRWRDVVPRAGKAPLFSVFALRAQVSATIVEPPLVVRDRQSRRTEEFVALRAAMGMPP